MIISTLPLLPALLLLSTFLSTTLNGDEVYEQAKKVLSNFKNNNKILKIVHER